MLTILRLIIYFLIITSLGTSSVLAQQEQFQREQPTGEGGKVLVWQGSVSPKGNRTPTLRLDKKSRYYIEVSRNVYFGRWQKNPRMSLVNDACYEFKARGHSVALPVFKNSLNVSVCHGKYHPNHIYRSALFSGNDKGIKFWIFDTDYRDNIGGLWVKVFRINPTKKQPVSKCTCEDLHRAAVFSLVLNGKVLKGGLGFSECLAYKKTLKQCFTTRATPPPPKPVKPRSKCSCQDPLRLGQFRLVLNGKVLRYGLGFSECIAYTKSLSQCRSK